ncbi:MAG: hypothetical protein ACREAC_24640, partial [Blastocatellia bacterium]
MKNHKTGTALLCAVCLVAFLAQSASTQQKAVRSGVQVHLVITDAALRDDADLPRLQQKDDVKVKQGKNFLNVTQLIPAQGENA